MRFQSAAAVMLALTPALTAQTAGDSSLAAYISARVPDEPGVGVVVGVLDSAGSHITIYGRGKQADGRPLSGHSVFEIGSVTKVFTAALLADMVRRGEVALDDPAGKYLPDLVKMPAWNGKEITLLDLATQTSGLPRVPGNLHPASADNPYANYAVADLYDFLSHYTLTRAPGSQYEYSNLGFGLLGHVLALRAGKDYESLLIERILGPLRLDETRITLTSPMLSRLAPGHADGVAVSNWDLPTLAGAGALRSTVSDMLKFLAANLDAADPLHGALDSALMPRRPIPGNQQIGLAWHISPRGAVTLTWHNGETGGYHAFVGLNRAAKRGVVMLTNSTQNIDAVAAHILDSAASSPPLRRAIALPVATLERYVGRYQFSPVMALEVTREDSVLYGRMTGQGRFRLYPSSERGFFLRAVPAEITFVADSTSRTSALILHQNGQDQRATRSP